MADAIWKVVYETESTFPVQWHFIPRIRDAKSDHQKLWFWATMAYSTTEVEEDLVILWSIWATNTQWMPPLLSALLQLCTYVIHTRLANGGMWFWDHLARNVDSVCRPPCKHQTAIWGSKLVIKLLSVCLLCLPLSLMQRAGPVSDGTIGLCGTVWCQGNC